MKFLENIKIDRKWWNNLDVQKQLTAGMALIILVLSMCCSTLFFLLMSKITNCDERADKIRVACNERILMEKKETEREKAEKEALSNSFILYLKEKDEQFHRLLMKQEQLNKRINETISN